MPPKSIENRTELAEFLGVSRNTLYKWLKAPGFPVEANGSVSPYKVGRWSALKEIEGDIEEEGEETSDVTTWKIKNLKEDHRRKKLANDATESSLLPRSIIAEKLTELANLIRGACEQVQREYGNDAAEIVGDTLDEFERRLNAFDGVASSDDTE